MHVAEECRFTSRADAISDKSGLTYDSGGICCFILRRQRRAEWRPAALIVDIAESTTLTYLGKGYGILLGASASEGLTSDGTWNIPVARWVRYYLRQAALASKDRMLSTH